MPIFGQKDFNSIILPKIEKSEKEYLLISNNEKKLESTLYKIMKDAEASDTSLMRKEEFNTTLKINKYLKADSKDRVSVLIELKTLRDVSPMVELIQTMDGTIEQTYKNFPYISCRIHPKTLRNLVSTISTVRISIPIQGHTRGIISAVILN